MSTSTVNVVLKQRTGSMTRSIREAETFARAWDRVGAVMSSLKTFTLGTVLGTAGLGFALNRIVAFNQEVETARNALATLYNTTGPNTWSTSVKAATKDVEFFKKAAAAGAGELNDYLNTYQQAFPQIGPALERSQTRELTRYAIAAAVAIRPDSGARTVGLDLSQAMGAGVRESQTPIIAAVLRANQVDFGKFNASTAKEKAETLLSSFKKFDKAAEEVGKSSTAQFDTLKDRMKDLIRALTGDAFEGWVDTLRGVNDWLEKILPMAEKIGFNFGPAAGKAALVGVPATGAAGAGGIGLVGMAYISRILGGGLGSAGNALLASRQSGLKHTVDMDSASGRALDSHLLSKRKMRGDLLTDPRLSFGKPSFGTERAAKASKGMLSMGLMGIIDKFGGAALAIGIFVAAFWGVVAIVALATTAFVSLKAAINKNPDALQHIKTLLEDVTVSFKRLGESAWKLAGSLYEKVEPALVAIGNAMIWMAEVALEAVARIFDVMTVLIDNASMPSATTAYDALTSPHATLAGAYYNYRSGLDPLRTTGRYSADELAKRELYGDTRTEQQKLWDAIWRGRNAGKLQSRFAEDGEIETEGPPAPTVNIGKVEVRVKGEVNADPRRIAAAFGQFLEETTNHIPGLR